MATRIPLVDPADFATRLGVDENDPLLELALRRASDRFRGAVQHPVDLIQDDVAVLDGNGSDTILLPAAPVTAITSVTVAGIPVTDYTASLRWGILRRTWRWPDDLGNVVVVYSHGYPEIPGDIVDAVIEQAESQYMVLAGIDSATSGNQTISFGKQGTIGVTQRWAETVARYQINVRDRA